MAHHIFQSENELQNIPEAAPSSQRFSVSERLARYGSSSLSGDADGGRAERERLDDVGAAADAGVK